MGFKGKPNLGSSFPQPITEDNSLKTMSESTEASNEPVIEVLPPPSSMENHKNRFELARKAAEAFTSGTENKIEHMSIPLEQLVSNPYNSRQFYVPSEVEKRAVSLQTDGQKMPIICAPIPNDPMKFYIVDGEYRFRAAKSLRWPDLYCRIDRTVKTSQQLYMVALLCNSERKEQSIYDDAVTWLKLIKDNIFANQQELGEALKKSSSVVSRTFNIAKLPYEIIEELSNSGIPSRVANEVAVLYIAKEDIELTRNFVKTIIDKELAVREAERLRKSLLNGDKRTRRSANSVSYSCLVGNINVGYTVKTFEDGKLTLSFSEIPVDYETELRDKIAAALGAKIKPTN